MNMNSKSREEKKHDTVSLLGLCRVELERGIATKQPTKKNALCMHIMCVLCSTSGAASYEIFGTCESMLRLRNQILLHHSYVVVVCFATRYWCARPHMQSIRKWLDLERFFFFQIFAFSRCLQVVFISVFISKYEPNNRSRRFTMQTFMRRPRMALANEPSAHIAHHFRQTIFSIHTARSQSTEHFTAFIHTRMNLTIFYSRILSLPASHSHSVAYPVGHKS